MDNEREASQFSRSLSPQDPDMREQLHLLQGREMILSQKLSLEREKRVHAERTSEMQRQACMELKLLLEKERKLSGRFAKSNDSSLLKELRRDVLLAAEESDGVSPKGSLVSHSPSRGESVAILNHSESVDKGDPTGLLLPLTSRDSLSHEVFSNLPEDLQEMLRPSSSITMKPAPVSTEQALLDAVTCGDVQALSAVLAAHGLPQNTTSASLILVAAARGFHDCLQVILEAGGDPNALGPDNATPLLLSAAEGHHKCVRSLIGSGANVGHRDGEGCTAVHRAALNAHEPCLRSLLDCGVDSLSPNTMGQTVLHAAVQSQSAACLRMVLTHLRAYHSEGVVSSLLNTQDANGQTVLHHAAGSSAKDCLEAVLPSPELDVDLRDRWNRTAVDVATTDCRDLLVNREYKEIVVSVSTQKTLFTSQESQFAVGRVRLLKHHKWSDFDFLVRDSISTYCKLLKGHPKGKTKRGMLYVRTPEAEKKREGKKQPEEIADDFYSLASPLALTDKPVAAYQVGQLSWKPGESPRGSQTRSLFSIFPARDGDPTAMEVVVTLKGKQCGSLNDAAFSSLYSVAALEGYLNLLSTYKNIVIHGLAGSGKSYLARLMADCLKSHLEVSHVEVTHASMHPGFKRDDFFRLLHYTGALVPIGSGGSSSSVLQGEGPPQLDSTTETPASPDSLSSQETSMSSGLLGPHIIILDDLDRIALPEVVAELLGTIDKRGPQHATWIGPTHSRGGVDQTHPSSTYYLRDDVYFIATMNKNKSGMLGQSVHGLFKHVWLSPDQEPLSGLLLRHLNRKLISLNRGALPVRSSPLYLTMRWVCDVWCLLNHFLSSMGLLEALVGPKHFLSCPVRSASTDSVTSWLAELWNSQLAPLIRDTMLYLSPSSPGQDRADLCAQVLTTLTQRVFVPTSPLEHQDMLKFILSLDGGEQGLALITEARKRSRVEGKSLAGSFLDLKDEAARNAIQRTYSAGSLPRHSVASTPSSTPQSTPGVSRRSTLLGNTPELPLRQFPHGSVSTSVLEGLGQGKTMSLPHNTPPISKREWKQAEKAEKLKKKKSIGSVFRKKSKLEDDVGSSSSSLGSTEDRSRPKEMDNLLELMFSMGDRLEEQRSPLPYHRHSSGGSPANGSFGVVSPLARDSSTTPTPSHGDSALLPPPSPTYVGPISNAGASVRGAREGEGGGAVRGLNGGRHSPTHRTGKSIPTVHVTSEP